MDGGDLGTVLDATAAGAIGLQAYVAGVVNQAATTAVIVTAALVAIMILAEIFKPAEDGGRKPTLAVASAAAGAGLVAQVGSEGSLRRSAVAIASRENDSAPELLPEAVLSAYEIMALTALRRRIQTGRVAEGATEPQRLGFARWLAEHGRLDR